jgi:prophage DNA circulation protein
MAEKLDGFLGKLEVTNEIGEQLDKQLQHAEAQVQQYIGGSSALRLGAVKVGELGVHIDKDLQEGKLAFESELVAVAYVKGYLRKASECLLNLSEKSKTEELIAHGKTAALKESLEIVKKHAVVAKSRTEQLLAAMEEVAKEASGGISQDDLSGDRRNRRSGQHPGPSSLDARRAERDAALAVEAQPVAEAAQQGASPSDIPPEKKARKRKSQPLIAT